MGDGEHQANVQRTYAEALWVKAISLLIVLAMFAAWTAALGAVAAWAVFAEVTAFSALSFGCPMLLLWGAIRRWRKPQGAEWWAKWWNRTLHTAITLMAAVFCVRLLVGWDVLAERTDLLALSALWGFAFLARIHGPVLTHGDQ